MSAGPFSGRQMHFIGVGGAGISAYARICSQLGASVSGSDRAPSRYGDQLAAEAILRPAIGQRAENLPVSPDAEVICSSAIAADNPELAGARARGLAVRSRAELLAELTAMKPTIAVAGTHGKSTTSAMLRCILAGAGMEPGWMIGAPLPGGLPNGEWGSGGWLVVEADESDRSLLSLNTKIAVLTNAELDHADAFSSLAELRALFARFLRDAERAVVWDQPRLRALAPAGSCFYAADAAQLGGAGSSFAWRGQRVRLPVPGLHNVLDAIAALEAARLAGAGEPAAAAALADFRSAGRRLESLGRSPAGAELIDDYAHHPTEVAATLAALRLRLTAPGRLIAVFQPHMYSRTRIFARATGAALAAADVICVLGVYGAREQAADNPGISGLTVARQAAAAAHGRPVYYLPAFADAAALLRGLLAAGDICAVMGAGDSDKLAHMLLGESSESAGGVGAQEPAASAGEGTLN